MSKKISYKFLTIIFLFVCSNSFAQDSTKADTFNYDWVGGIHLGVSYSTLFGGISNSFVTTSAAFKLGLEVEYKRFFLIVDGSWSNAKTKENFYQETAWVKNLPLDVENVILGIGHRFLIHDRFSLKPMFSLDFAHYRTDNRVKEFTKIGKDYEFLFTGFDLGIILHSSDFNYGGFELTIGQRWIAKSYNLKGVEGSEFVISFGYRGFNAH